MPAFCLHDGDHQIQPNRYFFSELNDFTNISLFSEFGSIVGYTESDINLYFGGYIRQAATALNLSEAEVRHRLRENYDGYYFDEAASVHVYATWSTLKFFSYPSRGFKNYWMGSGGKLTLLQQYLHNHALQALEDYAKEKELSYDDLESSSDIDNINDVALLTQAGYLTIQRFNEDSYYVSYPNKEVADSLAKLYRNLLLNKQSMDKVGAGDLAAAVRAGDVEKLFTAANHAFAAIDYNRHPIREEKHCQAFLQIFIAGAGFTVQSETHGALGRSDLEFDADGVHWVIELKYLRKGKHTAEILLTEAVQQIEARQYGLTTASRRLLRAAAVFSEESRQFCCWKEIPQESA